MTHAHAGMTNHFSYRGRNVELHIALHIVYEDCRILWWLFFRLWDPSSAYGGEEGAKLAPETVVLVACLAGFDLMLPNAETSARNIPATVRLCVVPLFQPDGNWPHSLKQIHI